MKKLISLLIAAIVLAGCSSGGDIDPFPPFGPHNPLNLNGHWVGTVNRASSTCPPDVTAVMPQTITVGFTIINEGSRLVVIDDQAGITEMGKIDTLTGEYSLFRTTGFVPAGSFLGWESGRAISNDEIQVDVRVTFSAPGLSCEMVYHGKYLRG